MGIFWVSSPSELFVAISGSEKYSIQTFFQRRVFQKQFILSLVFLGGGNFDARYFFGSKISGLCIFLGLQNEALSDPPPPPPPPPPLPVKYTSSAPSGMGLYLGRP